MKYSFTYARPKSKPRSKHSLVLYAALLFALFGVGLSVWMVIKTLSEPLSLNPPTPSPAAHAQTEPAALETKPEETIFYGSEFITDRELLREREQVARETAEVLRRQAQEEPETALSEDDIRAVERGDMVLL